MGYFAPAEWSVFLPCSPVFGLSTGCGFARVIGAEALADVFFVAFKIPNFFRRLFAEGAFAQAFVPVLGEYREKDSVAAVRELVSRVAGNLGLTLIFITLFIVLASPLMAAIFVPSWYMENPSKFAATAEMLRITFPYLLFISMTGVAGAVLNSYDRCSTCFYTAITKCHVNCGCTNWCAAIYDSLYPCLGPGAGMSAVYFSVTFFAEYSYVANAQSGLAAFWCKKSL